MYDTYKAIYKLSKLKYPNARTNARTNERMDICTPRAAFAAENVLVTHYLKCHQNSNVYSCTYCEEDFFQIPVLKKHLLESHNQDVTSTTCSECGEKFSSSHYLYKHKRVAHRNIIDTCDICNKKFNYRYLKKYMDIVHLQTSTKFTCETCGVERTNKVSFEDHVRIHFQTAKTEICIKCGKPFLTEIQLKSHFRTSHGETKYKCDVTKP